MTKHDQLIPVDRSNGAGKCPRCGRAYLCMVGDDGCRGLCYGDADEEWSGGDGKVGTDSGGRPYTCWRRDGGNTTHPSSVAPKPDRQVLPPPDMIPVADAATRDKVYRKLLYFLPLSSRHKSSLLRRGLNEGQAHIGMYGTMMPFGTKLDKVCGTMTRLFGIEVLRTVPGFYTNFSGKISLAGPIGLLIPIKDVNNQIIALSIRPDEPVNGAKYVALSSRARAKDYCGRPIGPSPGSPVHHPFTMRGKTVARLTEGALKAEVTTAIGGVWCVGLPGMSGADRASESLTQAGVRTVRVCFDADARTNTDVASYLSTTVRSLREKGLTVELETWDIADGKGIDDLLAAGKQPTLVCGDEAVDLAVADIRASAAQAKANKAEASSPHTYDDLLPEPPRDPRDVAREDLLGKAEFEEGATAFYEGKAACDLTDATDLERFADDGGRDTDGSAKLREDAAEMQRCADASRARAGKYRAMASSPDPVAAAQAARPAKRRPTNAELCGLPGCINTCIKAVSCPGGQFNRPHFATWGVCPHCPRRRYLASRTEAKARYVHFFCKRWRCKVCRWLLRDDWAYRFLRDVCLPHLNATKDLYIQTFQGLSMLEVTRQVQSLGGRAFVVQGSKGSIWACGDTPFSQAATKVDGLTAFQQGLAAIMECATGYGKGRNQPIVHKDTDKKSPWLTPRKSNPDIEDRGPVHRDDDDLARVVQVYEAVLGKRVKVMERANPERGIAHVYGVRFDNEDAASARADLDCIAGHTITITSVPDPVTGKDTGDFIYSDPPGPILAGALRPVSAAVTQPALPATPVPVPTTTAHNLAHGPSSATLPATSSTLAVGPHQTTLAAQPKESISHSDYRDGSGQSPSTLLPDNQLGRGTPSPDNSPHSPREEQTPLTDSKVPVRAPSRMSPAPAGDPEVESLLARIQALAPASGNPVQEEDQACLDRARLCLEARDKEGLEEVCGVLGLLVSTRSIRSMPPMRREAAMEEVRAIITSWATPPPGAMV